MRHSSKYIFITLLMSMLLAATTMAQDGVWQIYSSYHNVSKAVKAESRIFAIADGSLFSYDIEDESVATYDKSNALSDFGIRDIAFSKSAKTLAVLFNNGNVNLLNMDDESWCLPELKNKPLSDKTINAMRVAGTDAFVCTNSGLAVIDMRKRYFSHFYDIGERVLDVAAKNGIIYVKTPNGVLSGDRSKNLLDRSLWTKVLSVPADVVFGLTEEEEREEASMIEEMRKVTINSPARNYSYKLNMIDNRLLVAGGNFYFPDEDYPGMALKYEDGEWTQFDEEDPLQLVGDKCYMNVTDVVQDPNDPEHHWLGTMRSGIYEFKDYKLAKHYGCDNSPLMSILPNDRHPDWYTRVVGLNYDKDGNLWMLNTERDTIVRIITADGKWLSYYYKEIDKSPTFTHTKFDKRGWAWINARRTYKEWRAGLLIINTNGTIETQKDDKHVFLTTFTNQDGKSYSPLFYYCMTEDNNGAMWIGTSEGLFVSYDPEQLMNGSTMLTQVKVPRNDGTNLADYLLNSIEVSCITVDGGNRKWIGTNNNGVYLVSEDGIETIHHFTKDNSPLISDAINDIAINGQTGEVFIATYEGLCSFQGDAIEAATEMNSESLKVYPNPVRPEYSGNVHVTGLMNNSIVKIVNAAGQLVYEGKSTGGMLNWNCRTNAGKQVGAGVYYVLATDENGDTGASAKILIVR